MIKGSIARRYARALLIAGKEAGEVEALLREIEELAELIEREKSLFETIKNPSYSSHERRGVLRELIEAMGLSLLMQNFLLLLFDKRRIDYLPEIATSYRELSDEFFLRTHARVITASRISHELMSRLKKSLEQATKKEVLLKAEEDGGIIGGVIAQVGNTLYDYSIAGQLKRIRKELVE